MLFITSQVPKSRTISLSDGAVGEMKANVLGSARCLPARTVPRYERGGDVSLVYERLDVRIDGVASFERRERAAVNRRQRRLRSFPVNRRRVP